MSMSLQQPSTLIYKQLNLITKSNHGNSTFITFWIKSPNTRNDQHLLIIIDSLILHTRVGLCITLIIWVQPNSFNQVGPPGSLNPVPEHYSQKVLPGINFDFKINYKIQTCTFFSFPFAIQFLWQQPNKENILYPLPNFHMVHILPHQIKKSVWICIFPSNIDIRVTLKDYSHIEDCTYVLTRIKTNMGTLTVQALYKNIVTHKIG